MTDERMWGSGKKLSRKSPWNTQENIGLFMKEHLSSRDDPSMSFGQIYSLLRNEKNFLLMINFSNTTTWSEMHFSLNLQPTIPTS